MSSARIRVDGLDAFQRDLKEMGLALPRASQDAMAGALGEVVDYARPRIPKRTGRAAGSLKVTKTSKRAGLTLGGAKAPWAPWLDFGGEGRRKGRPPARPFIKTGRYVYAALAVKKTDIDQIMSDALTELAQQAGIEVS